VVRGTLSMSCSLTVNPSYDSTVARDDEVASNQKVTLHLTVKPREFILASAHGKAMVMHIAGAADGSGRASLAPAASAVQSCEVSGRILLTVKKNQLG
jgi:hypothetical protein